MRNEKGFQFRSVLVVMLMASLLLSGCGTFEFGIEPTGMPDVLGGSVTETAAPSPTGTVLPTPTPTPTPEASGLRVAVIADGYVWLWREGGAATPIASAGELAGVPAVKLSDDGAVVAFLRGGELWAVNSDGGEERRLVSADDLAGMARRSDYADAAVALHQFDWIPGTHRLAFNTRVEVRIQAPVYNDDLYVVDADSLELTTLLLPGEGGNVVFSPDGSRAAIVAPGSIGLIDLDGGNREEVFTYTPVMLAPDAPYYVCPVWASDGSALRVAIPPTDPSVPSAPTSIWHIPADETLATLVGSVIATPESRFSFSPDLSHLMYLGASEDASPVSDLLVTRLEDGETVSYAPAFEPLGWSPDSQHFAFVTLNPADPYLPPQAQIGQIGGDPMPIYETEYNVTGVTWVDDSRYVFMVGMDDGWEIRLGEIGGASMLIATVGEPLSQNLVSYDVVE